MPKPRAPRTNYAQRTLAVAKAVGGPRGRALANAVRSALTQPSAGSRTLVSSQQSAVTSFLGRYTPGVVPISVKKRMRKNPQIRYSLAAAKAPILRGDVWFDTNSTEVQALLNNVFLESGLFKRALRTALLAIEFGFSAHEQVWQFSPEFTSGWDVPNKGGILEHREKRYPNLFVPASLKELDPEAVMLLRDRFGELAGLIYGNPDVLTMSDAALQQALAQGDKFNVLGLNKCFVFTLGGEWQNHYGCGRLDSAYDPWYWQNIIYLVCNRWFERKGDPPLIGYAPSNPAIADPGVDADAYDPADEDESPVLLISRGLEKLRSTGNLGLPSDPYFDEQGKPSNVRAYEVKELETKDASAPFLAYIEHLDRKMARACLVPDAVAASQEGMGTYGSLQVMADVYVEVQNDTLMAFVEQFDRDVVQPFLAYNDIKDRASMKSGGITGANRDAAKEMLMKVLEADTLAEQAFGRIFPSSLTLMVDRENLMRANNIPFKRPDPDAPAPTPPQDPESAASGAAAGAAGQPQRGPAKKAAAVSVRMTEDEYVAHKVPMLIREGRKADQAVAVAHSMYRRQHAKARMKKTGAKRRKS